MASGMLSKLLHDAIKAFFNLTSTFPISHTLHTWLVLEHQPHKMKDYTVYLVHDFHTYTALQQHSRRLKQIFMRCLHNVMWYQIQI